MMRWMRPSKRMPNLMLRGNGRSGWGCRRLRVWWMEYEEHEQSQQIKTMTRAPDSGELTGFDLQLAATGASTSHTAVHAHESIAPVFWLTGLSGAGKSTLAE